MSREWSTKGLVTHSLYSAAFMNNLMVWEATLLGFAHQITGIV